MKTRLHRLALHLKWKLHKVHVDTTVCDICGLAVASIDAQVARRILAEHQQTDHGGDPPDGVDRLPRAIR
jgi:hypothetical protein